MLQCGEWGRGCSLYRVFSPGQKWKTESLLVFLLVSCVAITGASSALSAGWDLRTPSFKILILSPSGQSLASDASSIRGCWKAKGGFSPITGLLSLNAPRWIPIVFEECSAQLRHPREVPNLFSSFRFEGAHVLFWAERRNQTGTEMICHHWHLFTSCWLPEKLAWTSLVHPSSQIKFKMTSDSLGNASSTISKCYF